MTRMLITTHSLFSKKAGGMMSKAAAIQMCSSHLVRENLTTAAKLIKNAASNGAKLVVLPEMFAIMGKTPKDKVLAKEPFGHGVIQDFLSQEAKKNDVWLVGGTIPIRCDDPEKIRASCLVYNSLGKCMARYDKIHLFDAIISASESYQESDSTQAGDQVVVVDTPIGKLGLAVCYDLRFPHLFTALRNRGAEIIAVPSAFTVKTGEAHWKLLSRSRAIDSFCYIVGACQGGMHANGRKTYGHSLIVDPWGAVVDERQEATEGVVYAPIQLEELYKIRQSIPLMQHQKDFAQEEQKPQANIFSKL